MMCGRRTHRLAGVAVHKANAVDVICICACVILKLSCVDGSLVRYPVLRCAAVLKVQLLKRFHKTESRPNSDKISFRCINGLTISRMGVRKISSVASLIPVF